MGDAQQQEARRSGKGATTPQISSHVKADEPETSRKAGGDAAEKGPVIYRWPHAARPAPGLRYGL